MASYSGEPRWWADLLKYRFYKKTTLRVGGNTECMTCVWTLGRRPQLI